MMQDRTKIISLSAFLNNIKQSLKGEKHHADLLHCEAWGHIIHWHALVAQAWVQLITIALQCVQHLRGQVSNLSSATPATSTLIPRLLPISPIAQWELELSGSISIPPILCKEARAPLRCSKGLCSWAGAGAFSVWYSSTCRAINSALSAQGSRRVIRGCCSRLLVAAGSQGLG